MKFPGRRGKFQSATKRGMPMRKTILMSALALAFLPPGFAGAAERPAVLGFQALGGKCLEVVAGKDDLTVGCGPKVGIMRYADGRTGFYFLLAKDRMLTFSGFARGGDRNTYALDRVIYNDGTSATKPMVAPASGACSHGDPAKGPVTVRCKGRTPQGLSFSATFRTDGRPPKQ